MTARLSPTMSPRQFENGYWYREQLKDFAIRLGIPATSALRKDELERAILVFLRTGKATLPTTRALRKTGVRDLNFVADFRRADTQATRAEIIAAWNELKALDVPKDYASWIKARKR